MRFGRALRPLWLLDEGMVYLNHGSFGATPEKVLTAQSEWRQRLERAPVRFMERTFTPALREAAAALGRFLGACGEDLVFVENATAGVNAVLRSLQFAAGDEIVTTGHCYNAVRQALAFVAATAGVRVIEVDVPFPMHSAAEVVEAVAGALSERTKLAVFDHVTSPTALVLPVADLIALCRARGIPVLIDGAHAPGMIPLALGALAADWYTGNCHKWLCAPKGCAFLWTAPERQDATHPLVISHGYREGYLAEFDWTGTRDPSAWLAVTAALDFWHTLGWEDCRTYNTQLAREAAALLCERWSTEHPAPDDLLGTMATVELPPLAQPQALRERLWEGHRIEVPVIAFGGRLWVRISAQVYNESDEYTLLAAAVLEAAS